MGFYESPERAQELNIGDTTREGFAFANFAGALSLMALSDQKDWLELERFNR